MGDIYGGKNEACFFVVSKNLKRLPVSRNNPCIYNLHKLRNCRQPHISNSVYCAISNIINDC